MIGAGKINLMEEKEVKKLFHAEEKVFQKLLLSMTY